MDKQTDTQRVRGGARTDRKCNSCSNGNQIEWGVGGKSLISLLSVAVATRNAAGTCCFCSASSLSTSCLCVSFEHQNGIIRNSEQQLPGE